MDEEQLKFLDFIKPMNIEARYQQVKAEVAKSLNKESTANVLETTKQLHSWILERMQEKLNSR